MHQTILITGGAGFIGSHLVQKLFEEGKNILVLDNLNPQVHGPEGTSFTFNFIKNKCVFIYGDVQDENAWKALDDVDTIVHLASETGTGQSMYESAKYVSVNCLATAQLADALYKRKHEVRKIILASSRAIYGEGKYVAANDMVLYPETRRYEDLAQGLFECLSPETRLPLKPVPTDENSRINPLSVYALTKYFQENLLLNVCKSLHISYTALRFQNVFGPGQSLCNPYTGILSIFSNRMLQNKPVYIFEDGNESRDFVYVSDVVDSISLAIDSVNSDATVYNVGSGKSTSVLTVAQELRKLLNPQAEIIITGQFRQGDIRHNYADIAKIKNELQFDPHVSFNEGLKIFAEWVKRQELPFDDYEKSLTELATKGLLNKSS